MPTRHGNHLSGVSNGELGVFQDTAKNDFTLGAEGHSEEAAYHGVLYIDVPDIADATISTSSVATPTRITTAAAHGLSSGMAVRISGHLTATNLNNATDTNWWITVISATTFDLYSDQARTAGVPSIGGTAGTVSLLHYLAREAADLTSAVQLANASDYHTITGGAAAGYHGGAGRVSNLVGLRGVTIVASTGNVGTATDVSALGLIRTGAGTITVHRGLAAETAADAIVNIGAQIAAQSGANGYGLIVMQGSGNTDSSLGGHTVLSQAGADTAILSFDSSDVAHGMTDVAPTSYYATFQKFHATNGGLEVRGLSGGVGPGIYLRGVEATNNTTKSTAGLGVITISAQKKSSTTTTNTDTDTNLVALRDLTTTVFIFDKEGSGHRRVTTAWLNFDDEDDLALLNSLAHEAARPGNAIKAEFAEWLTYNRQGLQQVGLANFSGDHETFVNMSQLAFVHNGAIRQLGLAMKRQGEELALVRGQLARLQGAA